MILANDRTADRGNIVANDIRVVTFELLINDCFGIIFIYSVLMKGYLVTITFLGEMASLSIQFYF